MDCPLNVLCMGVKKVASVQKLLILAEPARFESEGKDWKGPQGKAQWILQLLANRCAS